MNSPNPIRAADAEMFFQEGQRLARLGRWSESAKAYQEAIRIHPNDSQAHLNLGFVYYELGLDTRAQDAFERARQLAALANPTEEMRL